MHTMGYRLLSILPLYTSANGVGDEEILQNNLYSITPRYAMKFEHSHRHCSIMHHSIYGYLFYFPLSSCFFLPAILLRNVLILMLSDILCPQTRHFQVFPVQSCSVFSRQTTQYFILHLLRCRKVGVR